MTNGDRVGQLHGMRCQHCSKSGAVPPVSPPQVVHIEETVSIAADRGATGRTHKTHRGVWRSNAGPMVRLAPHPAASGCPAGTCECE
jgi:hypothetical protein